MNKPIEIRPAIMDFAIAMERTLRKHDGEKGRGIKTIPGDYALERIWDEVRELDRTAYAAVSDAPGVDLDERVIDRIQEECTDTANFAAMLWWWSENKRKPKK